MKTGILTSVDAKGKWKDKFFKTVLMLLCQLVLN